MKRQRDLIESTDWDHLVILDAGRYDVFAEIYREHLDGIEDTPTHVHNGGVGYTADWFAATLDGEYDAACFHGGQPIYSMLNGSYDERDHFAHVPDFGGYSWDDATGTCPPDAVNAVVRRVEPDKSVIRYLQPHPPFREMVAHTRGRGNRQRAVARAVNAGEVSLADVRAAYRDNYEWGLAAVADLLPDLDGTVVVTADHGECLGDCGQWFHGKAHDPHDHLVEVPWLVVA